jgi:hypothetical protein
MLQGNARVISQDAKTLLRQVGERECVQRGGLVMWKDLKTRNGRCMKLNKPWMGPWEVIKRLGEVVYRIKYSRVDKVLNKVLTN